MARSDYGYDEDEFDHPLSEPNWRSQTRVKFMKFLIMNSTNTKDSKAASNHNRILRTIVPLIL